MLNLRLSGGVDHKEFQKKFNLNFIDTFYEIIEYLNKYNLINSDKNSTLLTEKGKLLSDSIFLIFEEKIQSSSF